MKKQKVIYTISVLSKRTGVLQKFGQFRYASWGYYFKQEHAAQVIETNATDISEQDYYHYAVLSSRTEGPLAISETIQWYEFIWDHDLDHDKFVKAKKIKRPAGFEHTYGE